MITIGIHYTLRRNAYGHRSMSYAGRLIKRGRGTRSLKTSLNPFCVKKNKKIVTSHVYERVI